MLEFDRERCLFITPDGEFPPTRLSVGIVWGVLVREGVYQRDEIYPIFRTEAAPLVVVEAELGDTATVITLETPAQVERFIRNVSGPVLDLLTNRAYTQRELVNLPRRFSAALARWFYNTRSAERITDSVGFQSLYFAGLVRGTVQESWKFGDDWSVKIRNGSGEHTLVLHMRVGAIPGVEFRDSTGEMSEAERMDLLKMLNTLRVYMLTPGVDPKKREWLLSWQLAGRDMQELYDFAFSLRGEIAERLMYRDADGFLEVWRAYEELELGGLDKERLRIFVPEAKKIERDMEIGGW